MGRLIPARAGKRAFLAALALLGVVGMGDAALAAPRSAIHQLGEKGSYEIGFQSYVVTDDSRDALPFADRPIPVYVFYPVDGATIAPSTPQAVYPLDPLYGFLPGTVSSAWETYGLDRAYQSPEASSLGPFPPERVDAVLANSCTPYMPHQEVTSLIPKYMVGFLKTELVGESGYKNLRTPGWALTQESAIEFFVTEKKSPHSIDEDWPDWFAYFLHQPGSAQAIGATDPPETTAIPITQCCSRAPIGLAGGPRGAPADCWDSSSRLIQGGERVASMGLRCPRSSRHD